MAIPINVEDLINQRIVESNRIEYKADYNPAAIIRSICAFANDIDNTGGGYIVVGVEEENGAPRLPVRGLERAHIDAVLKKLREHCHAIEPLYEPVAEPVLYQDAYVIVIWAAGGFGRPYKAPRDVTEKHSTKQYYIRKFANSVIASPEEERELFYVSSSIPFDDRPNLAAEVNDLDLGLLREHLHEVGSSADVNRTLDDLAQDMQLLAGPPERLKPRNVGILMFSERPEKYFRYARIEIADLPDPTGENMQEKVFTGPIQRQLRDALAYLKNYVLEEKVVKPKGRAEAERMYNYPYAAVEEILSNAVYHRSYQIDEPILVRITPASMEITSYPGFDRSISDSDIRDFSIRSRVYRNRRIGDFLKELRLIEGRNTGFPNAIRALKENGSPMLAFEMDENRSYLSVTIPVHPAFLPRKASGMDSYRRRIIDSLSTPMTLTELARAMGYKGITAKLRDTLTQMVNMGDIERFADVNDVKYRVRG
ncbi:MAG: putative DNA binding domain-containing protein [Clostridia bacterium]|nr:putative DNA binding domain-containing protein [Clostridia bacterium]